MRKNLITQLTWSTKSNYKKYPRNFFLVCFDFLQKLLHGKFKKIKKNFQNFSN
jgi:hypothetical protein